MASISGNHKYQCRFRFMVYKDEFSAAHSDKFDFTKKNFVGDLRGFEAVLFKLYSARVKVTGLDTESVENIDLHWSTVEDEDN